jgi:hypothetical protein
MPIPFNIRTIVTKLPNGTPVTVSAAIKVRNLLIQTIKNFLKCYFIIELYYLNLRYKEIISCGQFYVI